MLKTNLPFTPGQLDLVRSCAEQCIGDGTPSRYSDEWAVFETVNICHGFAADQRVIMHLIAKQCEKRHLGAMSVYQCIVAFNGIYAGEDLPSYPALVAQAVNTVSPETAPRVLILTPVVFDFGRDGMGPWSLN